MIRALLSLTLLAGLIAALPAFAAPETFEQKSCRIFYGNILGPSEEEREIFGTGNSSFYKIPQKSSGETGRLNQRLLKSLRGLALPVERRNSSRITRIDAPVREKLFRDVMALPEVQESLCGSYRGSGKFGFCFGRAFAVHLKALRSGIDKRRIRKIWAVGDLRAHENKWKYHVSTIIQGDDGIWYAFDPSFGQVLTVDEWYAKIRSDWDPARTARLYSTAAGQLFPYDWKGYSSPQLQREVFRKFFTDLMETMKREALTSPATP